MNKEDQNVRCFSQFKNSYGKVRAELGFFQASCFLKVFAVFKKVGICVMTSQHDWQCQWNVFYVISDNPMYWNAEVFLQRCGLYSVL